MTDPAITLSAHAYAHVPASPGPSSSTNSAASSIGHGLPSAAYLQDHATVLITRPLQILAVIVAAMLVRFIAHRAIDKLTVSNAEGRVPKILSPLTERAANSRMLESTGLMSERRRQRAASVGSILKSTVSFVLFVTCFLIILDILGVNLLPFVAGTSLIGVAVGFGAQNIIKDFLAGLFMILEDQYGVGDVIDLKEAIGTVEAVGLRTTRIRDVSGTVWYVRNGEIVRVGNQSQQFAQVVLDVAIAAEDDVAQASSTLSDVAERLYADTQWSAAFLNAPEVLGVESMTRDETLIRLTARVRPMEQWRVARELRARILKRFADVRIQARDAQEASD